MPEVSDPLSGRPVPWPALGLYLAVPLTAGYDTAVGLCGGPARYAGLVVGLLALLALDLAGRGRDLGRSTSLALLGGQLALVEVVVLLDCSQTATLLRLLIVFAAYFTLGRWGARGITAGYATALVARTSATDPGWWRDTTAVADLLMAAVALVAALAAADVVARLDRGRARAQQLVDELEASRALVQEQVARSLVATARAERLQLARDVHDGLGHHLTAVSVQLQKAGLFMDRDLPVARAAVADAHHAARQALADVRRSVGTLRESDPFELRDALEALHRGVVDAGQSVVLEVDGDDAGIEPIVLLTAYRVVQEALTNVQRHASATRVRVQVELDPAGGVRIKVIDDGRGFDLPAFITERSGAIPSTGSIPSTGAGTRGGLGLRGMRERVELVGGRLELNSAPGTGTRVRAELPARMASGRGAAG